MKRKLAIIVLAVLTCLFSVCGVACFETGNSSKFELVSFKVTGIEQTNELGEYEVESNIVNVSIYLTHEIEGEFSELSLQRGSDGQIFVIDKTIEKYNCTLPPHR